MTPDGPRMTPDDPPLSQTSPLELRRVEEQTLACLPCRGPYWRLSGALEVLRGWLRERHLDPTGPLLAAFLDDPATILPSACRYVLAYPVEPRPSSEGDRSGGEVRGDLPPDRNASTADVWESLFALDESGQVPDGIAHPRLCRLPAGPVAQLEYRGVAKSSPVAYAELAEGLRRAGLTPEGPPEEVYLAEPGTLEGGLMHAVIRRRLAPEG